MSRRPGWTSVIAAGIVLILAASGGACSGERKAAAGSATAVASDRARTNMTLRIKLRDGFRDQTVVITVDGREVYRKSGVTTDLSISYADAVEASTGAAPVKLAVRVENGPAASADIDPRRTPFVDVRVMDGKMELRASAAEQPML